MKKILVFIAMFYFVFFAFGNEKVNAANVELVAGKDFSLQNINFAEFENISNAFDNDMETYATLKANSRAVGGNRFVLLKKSVGSIKIDVYANADVNDYGLLGVLYAQFAQSIPYNKNTERYETIINSEVSIQEVGLYNSRANDLKVYEINMYSEFDVPDVVSPGVVKNVQYVFNEDNSVSYNYDFPDDSDFSHLEIYQDDELLQTNHKLQNFKITGLEPKNNYTFKFVSVDTSGNKSEPVISNIAMPDGPDLIAPNNITDLNHKITGNTVQFNYLMPIDADFSHLQIYRNNELIIENHKINSFVDSDLKFESNYNYVFKSVDHTGNVSEGKSISITTGKELDLIAPEVPEGLTVKNGNSALYVTWNPNSETDIQGYNIYVNDKKYNGSIIAGNSFTIPNLKNGLDYNIKISAVDTSENESGKTTGVNGVPDAKAMPIVEVKNNLGAVADSTENWFSQLWLPLAFGVSIPLSFIIGMRIKALFLG